MDISKLDAAKRQLDTAVALYFRDGDVISMHTLAAAAHQVLMDLSKLEGIKSLVKETTLIREERKKEYILKVNEAENFFKHATTDRHKLLDFNPEVSEFLIFDAIGMYTQLTHEITEDYSIFKAWFFVKYPSIISDETRKKLEEENINYIDKFGMTNKADFYRTFKNALLMR